MADTRIVGIRRAVACDVEDDFVLRLGFGEKSEEGAANILRGGVVVEEEADVVFGEGAAVGREQEVAEILGVAVGELEAGDASGGVGVTGDANDHSEFVGACYRTIGSDGGALLVARCGGVGGLQEEGSVMDARSEIRERKLDGVAA